MEAALDAVLDAEIDDDGYEEDDEGDDDDDEEEEEEEEDGDEKEGMSEPPPSPAEEVVAPGKPPDNFSRVDPSLPHTVLQKDFPHFLEATCLECEVKEGDMLYLPAGWFHEVR